MADDLTVLVAGQNHGGWKTVTETETLEAIAATFDITVSDRWPGQESNRPIAEGDACAITIDQERVLTGSIDLVEPSYDDKDHTIRITGRSRAGDLVDCMHIGPKRQWTNASVEAILGDLMEPFGLPLVFEAAADPFPVFKYEENETVFEAIERLCRMRGLLATSDANGAVRLIRPGGRRATVVLHRSENILSAGATRDSKKRFSHYIVKGSRPDPEIGVDPSELTGVMATVRDSAVKRYRPFVTIAEKSLTRAEAETRATWQRDYYRARSEEAVVTVQGWRQTQGGPLWMPGLIVSVDDDWLGIHGDRLIVSVTRTKAGENQGTKTRLTLWPVDAFVTDATATDDDDADKEALQWRL